MWIWLPTPKFCVLVSLWSPVNIQRLQLSILLSKEIYFPLRRCWERFRMVFFFTSSGNMVCNLPPQLDCKPPEGRTLLHAVPWRLFTLLRWVCTPCLSAIAENRIQAELVNLYPRPFRLSWTPAFPWETKLSSASFYHFCLLFSVSQECVEFLFIHLLLISPPFQLMLGMEATFMF